MSQTYVIVLDGVLSHGRTGALNTQGMHLYASLASTGRLAILCGQDYEKADYFLKSNGLKQHAYLIPEDPMDAPDDAGRRMGQIGKLRAQSCNVEFVVEPNPAVAARLFDSGIPTLLYLHPLYSNPAFRPDYENKAKPWDDLVNHVDYQTDLRANTPEFDPLADD